MGMNWDVKQDAGAESRLRTGRSGSVRTMSGPSEQQVLDALRAVRDDERGGDIVGLGMVSGLAVREGHVAFALEVEPARAPRLEPLRQRAEAAVDALPGVLSVSAVLTAQRPAAGQPAGQRPAAAGHAHGEGRAAQGRALVPGVRAIVAVASG